MEALHPESAERRLEAEEAKREHGQGNQEKALDYAFKAKQTLGKPSVKIQGMLVRYLFAAERWNDLPTEARIYFQQCDPDPSSADYQDVMSLTMKAEEKAKAARAEAERQRQLDEERKHREVEDRRQEEQRLERERRDEAARRERERRAATARLERERREKAARLERQRREQAIRAEQQRIEQEEAARRAAEERRRHIQEAPDRLAEAQVDAFGARTAGLGLYLASGVVAILGVAGATAGLYGGWLLVDTDYGDPDADVTIPLVLGLGGAAVAAGAHDFITKMAGGYDTVIGDLGSDLSQGQKQRLAIARALLRDAPLLILDEPTSALDAQTEATLMESLERLRKGRTTILIAHRLSTVRGADRIIVLEDGQVVEQGSHEDLLDLRGRYHNLYSLQTDKVG